MPIEERIQPAIAFKANGLFPMLERFTDFRHPLERDYLEGSRDLVFRNTFSYVEYTLQTCAVTAPALNSNATM